MLTFLRRAYRPVLAAACLLLLMPAWGLCKPVLDNPFYDEPDVLSPAFLKTYKDSYLAGRAADAYTQWLRQAWQGDMHAMATLAALSRTQAPRSWPVPPEFWEHWLVELLGEGEGAYVLGQQYGFISDTLQKGHPTVKKAEEFFLRSALAGHLPATYPAGFTAEGRDGTSFTPPSSPHVTPIPLRFISDDTRGETRYWWTRGADAGYWKAAVSLGWAYAKPDSGAPDYDMAEHYMTIAAENGLRDAALDVGFSYVEGKFHRKPLCEGIYTYILLGNKLRGDGEATDTQIAIAQNIAKEHPNGKSCLKPELVEAGVAESKRLYDAWKTKYDAQQRALKQLYDKARKRLPEVKAAYEQARKEHRAASSPR